MRVQVHGSGPKNTSPRDERASRYNAQTKRAGVTSWLGSTGSLRPSASARAQTLMEVLGALHRQTMRKAEPPYRLQYVMRSHPSRAGFGCPGGWPKSQPPDSLMGAGPDAIVRRPRGANVRAVLLVARRRAKRRAMVSSPPFFVEVNVGRVDTAVPQNNG